MQAIAEGLPVAFQTWVFLVGAVVGSFLNVVIARVPKGESIVSPPSRCPNCKAPIAWYDNIPLLSWLWLRGKCRRCGQPISLRYPMVELLVALLAVAVVRRFGPTPTSLATFAFVAALVALAYIDLDTWLLPHQITWPLLAVGLASPLWNRSLSWTSSIIGGVAGFALFAAIALFGEKLLKRETMGWGDVWLLSGIGAWLGWQALFAVVMLSAVQGSVVGVVMLLVAPREEKEKESGNENENHPKNEHEHDNEHEHELDDDWVPPKHAVPYGPFLALAALEQLLAGNRLAAAWDFLLRRLFG